MKNKIKGMVYGASALVLTLPTLVFGAAGYGTFDPEAVGSTGLAGGSIMEIVTNIMKWLLTAVGIAGVIGFAIAGILYLTAAGDETRIKSAKSAMVASITGVVVAIVGVVALTAANTMLKGNAAF